jgi:hypothetical protein
MEDSVSFTRAELLKFTGTFRLNDKGKEKIRTIECRGKQLFYVVDNKTTILLIPVSEYTFRLNGSATTLHFKMEEDRSIAQLTIQKGSGGVITAELIQ